ncbi:MAG: 3-mercaptopyruvate sulfurtransferase [Bradyrhizobiaceae bacterium]|nr:MAG: 3-mercaptopyruvate sulfurtransferase [Bradyrhizobiaceae bacterium]
MTDPLVSTAWLHDHLSDSDIRVIDAAYRMPAMRPPLAADEYKARHIRGAVFFDIDQVADHTTNLPHMLPPPLLFAREVGALGIESNDLVVIYDRGDYMGAPRAWWTFGTFGHDRVKVLDGGLKKWIADGYPVDAEIVTPAPRTYHAHLKEDRVRRLSQMRDNVETGTEQVIDARARERFEGTAAEPWPGRRSGRIPGSLNVPFNELIDPVTGEMKSAAALRTIFEGVHADLGKPIVTTCGSGVTAGVLSLALARLGVESALYDGSWAEWGLPDGPRIDTGKI